MSEKCSNAISIKWAIKPTTNHKPSTQISVHSMKLKHIFPYKQDLKMTMKDIYKDLSYNKRTSQNPAKIQ